MATVTGSSMTRRRPSLRRADANADPTPRSSMPPAEPARVDEVCWGIVVVANWLPADAGADVIDSPLALAAMVVDNTVSVTTAVTTSEMMRCTLPPATALGSTFCGARAFRSP